MANVCINRLFIKALPEACERLQADLQGPADEASGGELLSFAVLLPEPQSGAGEDNSLGPGRASWRLDHWGTTVDPLTARTGGDPASGGVDYEFETSAPPLAWTGSLAAAHPRARLHLLFDCPDDQRAGEVVYTNGVERRRSEIGPEGYELWAEHAAAAGIYGTHDPPYDTVGLD